MTATPPVVAIKRAVTAREGHRLWIISCPFCGRDHVHGGQPGHRVAHCGRRDVEGIGYILVARDGDP